MNKDPQISGDIALSILGAIILILLKNATRFLGIGLISLGITYFLYDRYTFNHGRHLTNRYGK